MELSEAFKSSKPSPASTLTVEQLKKHYDEIADLVAQASELRVAREGATGETARAYELVYNDFLWKIQRRIGQLHFWVCDFDGFPSPFKSD
jgi:hypothetical protein